MIFDKTVTSETTFVLEVQYKYTSDPDAWLSMSTHATWDEAAKWADRMASGNPDYYTQIIRETRTVTREVAS